MPFLNASKLDEHQTTNVQKDENCRAYCGSNTVHHKSKNKASLCTCECKPNYFGNPNLGCQPGCVLNSDCPVELACLNYQCQDPCPGVCGHNSICIVTNQRPSCYCKQGYGGNPFEGCSPTITKTTVTTPSTTSPHTTTSTITIVTHTTSTAIVTSISNTSNNHCKIDSLISGGLLFENLN